MTGPDPLTPEQAQRIARLLRPHLLRMAEARKAAQVRAASPLGRAG